MAFTITQLEALEAAIAQGAKRVKYTDKEVEYNSYDDMIKLRDRMRIELGLVTGTARRIYHSTCKGTDTDGGSDE